MTSLAPTLLNIPGFHLYRQSTNISPKQEPSYFLVSEGTTPVQQFGHTYQLPIAIPVQITATATNNVMLHGNEVGMFRQAGEKSVFDKFERVGA